MSEPSTTPASKSRITPAQWTEAKALWESGEFTLTQIAKRVGATREHLSRRFKKEGIEKGSRTVDSSEVVKGAVESELSRMAKVLPARIAETKNQHYEWSTSIGKLNMQLLGRAIKEGRPVSSISEDVRTLDRAAAVLAKVMEQRYKALGIDREDYVDDETLPSLTIDVMTDEEMEDIRQAARERGMGLDDGMGGLLDGEDDDVVEEDFTDEELSEVEEALDEI